MAPSEDTPRQGQTGRILPHPLCQSTAPTPLDGYLQPPTYRPETRPSIAHKPRQPRQEDHVGDSTHSSDASLLGTAWKSTSRPRHSAPVIGLEAENPSGERGTGQAETARAVRCSSAFPFNFTLLGQTTLNHMTY